MTRLTRFDGPADCMQPIDDTHLGHLALSFEIGLLKGFLVLDRSAVNGSPLPLGEEPLDEEPSGGERLAGGRLAGGRLAGGRLTAFTGLSTLCFECLLASAFFVTP